MKGYLYSIGLMKKVEAVITNCLGEQMKNEEDLRITEVLKEMRG